MDFQASFGSSRSNELDDNFKVRWDSPPIASDVAEQPMLDFVPLAGSRREMTDLNDHPRLVGELWSSSFQSRVRELLLPPLSAVMSNRRLIAASGNRFHQRRIASTANSAVSCVIPTETPASLWFRS